MKTSIWLIGLFLLAGLCAYPAHSLGITTNIETDYIPNATKTFEFCIRNSKDVPDDIKIEVEGPLAEYITLEFPDRLTLLPKDTSCYAYTVHMPAEMKVAGRIASHIVVTEIPEEAKGTGFQFTVVVSIRHRHMWIVPYPGKYMDLAFDAYSAKENEPVKFLVKGISRGWETISKVHGYVEIYDAVTGALVGTVQLTEAYDVKTSDTVSLEGLWDTKGRKTGAYKAKAYVYYDDKDAEFERLFQIGSLRIDVVNHTQIVYNNTVNKFDIFLLSNWNDPVENVYADVRIRKGDYEDSFTTPFIKMEPFSKATLSSFWDTKGTDVGIHDLYITMHYSNVTETAHSYIQVIAKPDLERPSPISTTTLLIILVIIMVILNIFWLAYNKYKRIEHGKGKGGG